VDKAATRMRQRYVEIVARRDISEDVRHLALEIAKRVDQAHRNFNFDQQISTGNRKANTPYVDEVETMIIQGREFISKKMWREADEVLAKAHQKRIDNVPVLANLGWARLHNPSMDLETRTEEGTDFLLLAEQFDPSDADGQYYLAQVLFASGRLEAAEQRAERAVKAAPEDKIRQALRRKIRLMVKQQNES
jgi:tetratricopeptide (TPR) repeat protein